MAEKKQEIARALVQLAWADGQLTPEETELLAKYLKQLGYDEATAAQAWLTENQPVDYAGLRQALPDLAERIEVMRELINLSCADDALTFDEFDLVDKMAQALEISEEQMEALRVEASSAEG